MEFARENIVLVVSRHARKLYESTNEVSVIAYKYGQRRGQVRLRLHPHSQHGVRREAFAVLPTGFLPANPDVQKLESLSSFFGSGCARFVHALKSSNVGEKRQKTNFIVALGQYP